MRLEAESSTNCRRDYVSVLEYMSETDYLAPLGAFIVETVHTFLSL
jgi:hypothetical protein